MDVRGRGESALMVPSIAPWSTEGKEFAKICDGFGHVGSSDADDRRLCVGLLVNLASAGAHFAQILVVWRMKSGDLAAKLASMKASFVDILRNSAQK